MYKNNELFYYIDGYDVQKSNWMRYVNPAYSSESQNLIACQYKVSETDGTPSSNHPDSRSDSSRVSNVHLERCPCLFFLQMNIYFYTIKPILPNQELLVWYCREFAERLNYPLTGELMLQRIRKRAFRSAFGTASATATCFTRVSLLQDNKYNNRRYQRRFHPRWTWYRR